MRMMLGLTVLAASVVVGGCGKSSEARLAEARQKMAEYCRSSPPAGFDAERYCSCVVDRSIGNKTAAQIGKMTEKEQEQLGIKSAGECMAQLAPASPGAPVGQAPAEAAQQSSEAVKEAADAAD